MKITAIIPARKGSKRIPDKNIKELQGIPLFMHSVIAAVTSQLVGRVIVSTNYDPAIIEPMIHGEAEILRRPDDLCGDEAGDWDVLSHATRECGLTGLVAYLRPTTPIRVIWHIDQAIKLLQATPGATGLRSVELMDESAYKCFEMQLSNRLRPILYDGHDITDFPNQHTPLTYKPNGHIDIARVGQIEQGNLWGDGALGYLTPHTPEIDTPANWEYVEWMMRRTVAQNLIFGMERL